MTLIVTALGSTKMMKNMTQKYIYFIGPVINIAKKLS